MPEDIARTVHGLIRALPRPNRQVMRMLYGLYDRPEMSPVQIALRLKKKPEEVEKIIAESYTAMQENLPATQKWLETKINGPATVSSTLATSVN